MQDEQDGRPRRQTPADVASRRAARQLVGPMHDQLGLWQAESIKLETMAERVRSTGRTDAELVAGVRRLLDAVSQQAAALDGAVAEVPASVGTNSRVSDVRKVLKMLEERLNATLRGLDRPPGV